MALDGARGVAGPGYGFQAADLQNQLRRLLRTVDVIPVPCFEEGYGIAFGRRLMRRLLALWSHLKQGPQVPLLMLGLERFV